MANDKRQKVELSNYRYKTMEIHQNAIDISVIIPIYNGEKWIDKCFDSIIRQTALEKNLKIEISVFDDASVDNTNDLLNKWKVIFINKGLIFIMHKNSGDSPRGAGYAKNKAVKASSGGYLCFQDIDDQMLPDRIWKQYLAAKSRNEMIIGSKFYRDPPESTERYTKWANSLSQIELNMQIYTSHGPTIIMPTWFCHRSVFHHVGGFSEEGTTASEDLIFIYKHFDQGRKVYRVEEYLLIYSYHLGATTFSISSDYIWDLRLKQLQKDFLSKCNNGFSIWNAGKQGRKFLKSLNEQQRSTVISMCDVDKRKIGKFYEMYCPIKRKVISKIPIVHFSQVKPPIIICLKMDMTDGVFEENLRSLNLKEGTDYILFS